MLLSLGQSHSWPLMTDSHVTKAVVTASCFQRAAFRWQSFPPQLIAALASPFTHRGNSLPFQVCMMGVWPVRFGKLLPFTFSPALFYVRDLPAVSVVGSWWWSSFQTRKPNFLKAQTLVFVSRSWSSHGCGSVACSPFLLTLAQCFNLLPPPPLLPSPFTHSLSLPLPVCLSVWPWNWDPKASIEQQQDRTQNRDISQHQHRHVRLRDRRCPRRGPRSRRLHQHQGRPGQMVGTRAILYHATKSIYRWLMSRFSSCSFRHS